MGKPHAAKEEVDQCLQGVLLADSFVEEDVFKSPKCLVEVCGIPLIEYTLSLMDRCGAGDVLVACVDPGPIRDYLGDRENVRIVEMRGCTSTGDVLRELDQRGLIKSDPFVATSASSLCGADLTQAIREHIQRKSRNPEATMTMILCEGGPRMRQHVTPTESEDLCVAADDSGRLLGYDKVEIDTEILQKSRSVEIRADLIDCCVDICSPEVLWRYSENFDYQKRYDFVTNEIASDLGQHVHAKVVSEYGCCVDDPRALSAIQSDVLCGYMEAPRDLSGRGQQRRRIPRSSRLRDLPNYVGGRIGERCVVSRSVIGDNSVVADDAVVEKSTLGSECDVGPSAKIRSALLGNRVTVAEGVTIPRGCVVGDDARVDHDLSEYDRIVSPSRPRESSSQSSFDLRDDDDQAEDGEMPSNRRKASAPGGEDDAIKSRAKMWQDDWGDERKMDSQDVCPAVTVSDDVFAKTVGEMVASGYRAGADVDSLVMELNCYKLSENRSFREAAPAALNAIVDLARFEAADANSLNSLLKSIRHQILTWTPLLKKVLGEDPDNQAHTVAMLADHFAVVFPAGNNQLANVFRATLQLLYDAEVLSDDAIISWAALNANKPLVASKQIVDFIAWLEEEEEEETDEEEEEESD